MRTSRVLIVGVAICGFVATAACRDKRNSSAGQPTAAGAAGTPPAASGRGIDACSLLTDEEIKRVIGRAVHAKKPGSGQGIFSAGCQWTLEGDASGIPDIDLGVMNTGGRKYYDDYFERYIGDADEPLKKTRLAGVGDKGLITETGDVMVVKGDVLISINYASVPANKSVATELAKVVVGRAH